MLDFPRWKVISIWAVLIALMALAIPSFPIASSLPPSIAQYWPTRPHINLGLDLAGGSYLLLEADTNDLANSRIENMRDQIQAEMKRNTPRIDIGDISTRGGQLSFMLRDPTQVDAAREALLTITGSGAGMTGQRQWDIQVVDTSRFVLTPTKAGLAQAVDQAMGDEIEVVRKRIDELGTREPTIIRQGTDRIVVQVPGLQNPQALKDLLGKTAKLEFKMVDDAVDPSTLTAKSVAPIGDQILPNVDVGGGFLAVKRSAIITGDELVNAQQGYDPQTNAPDVDITFDSQGGRKFAKVTQASAGKRFAMILDNQIISAPTIDEPILGGKAMIHGSFTVQSANELAIALRSGKLPIALKVIEESTVGPDLGADSIHAGILASIVAVALVIIFMFVTYGRFGLYANLAVVINVVVILGVLALLGGTLTLPGIAGFVLTIGTAVDANVLINERIREERRRGRNVVQAVELGYKEASRTIFEANATHAISGIIMFFLGSGPVKGFAVVLLIGIVTGVFTAVTFTRMLVAQWIRKNRPSTMNI
jgi:preprotein translocase subunit SecD